MKPLASSPVFTDLIGRVAHIPVLGVAVGTFMTLVVQSSSATIAVLQNFASQPGPDGVTSILGLAGAIPILLGDNIGTTITALLASIGQSKDAKRTAVAHLDENIISQPAAALQLVAKEIFRMSDQVRDILKKTIELVKNEEVKSIDGLKENGEQVERLGKCITEYLAALFSSGLLTEQQAAQTASLMCVLSDVERMGTLSVEMAECMLERSDRKYKYTPEAMDELQKSLKVLNKMFCDSLKALQGDDGIEPGKMMKRKDKLLDLDIKMRKAHIERVNKGKCKASLTAPFTNILHLIDRMGNSCINLADVAESGTSMKYFMLEEK